MTTTDNAALIQKHIDANRSAPYQLTELEQLRLENCALRQELVHAMAEASNREFALKQQLAKLMLEQTNEARKGAISELLENRKLNPDSQITLSEKSFVVKE